MTQFESSRLPVGTFMKAIVLPSGDHAGSNASALSNEVSWRTSLPSGAIVKICGDSARSLPNTIGPSAPGNVASAGVTISAQTRIAETQRRQALEERTPNVARSSVPTDRPPRRRLSRWRAIA